MKFARGHFYVPLYKPGATVYLHSQLKAVDKCMQMRVWSCIYTLLHKLACNIAIYCASGRGLKVWLCIRYLSLSLSSRFQDVKEYADELEGVFKSLLAIREVGRVRVQSSEVKVHSSSA